MKNYGAKLQPIPGHVIQTHQSRGPGLAAVMAVGSSIIIFFFPQPNAVASRGSITGVAAFVLSKRGVNSGEEKTRRRSVAMCAVWAAGWRIQVQCYAQTKEHLWIVSSLLWVRWVM